MRQICCVALGVLLIAVPGLVLADNTKLKKPLSPPDAFAIPKIDNPGMVRGPAVVPPRVPIGLSSGLTGKVPPSTTTGASN